MPSGESPLPSPIDRRRLNLCAAAILVGLVIGFAIALLSADGLDSFGGTIGGDYASFHAAGSLVADGRGAEIYDWDALKVLQQPYLAGRVAETGREVGLLPFSYAPFVAVLFAALSQLPFLAGYAVYVALLGAALLGAVRLLPRQQGNHLILFAGALSFYPILLSIIGAQNTVITLLLIVAAWRALDAGGDVRAGVFFGLMLFKPQFGLTFLALAVLGGRPRVLLGAAPVAVGLYLLSATIGGWGWPVDWLRHSAQLHMAARSIEADNAVGLVGFFGALLGPDSDASLIIGWGLTAVLGLGLVALWRRPDYSLAARMAGTTAGAALLSPHSNFYDAGLAVLVVPVLLNIAPRRAPLPLLGLFLLSWTEPLSVPLGVNPLFGFLLLALALTLWLGREKLDTD